MFEIVFCTVFSLIAPAVMLGCGVWFVKAPPDLGGSVGYCTELSQKNSDTWITAHRISGRFWTVCGAVSAVLSAGAVIWTILRETEDGGLYNTLLWLAAAQTAVLLAVIPYTEVKMKKIFDGNGSRRNGV
ncbi:MAG: SdpI family protein [Ruminococcus sp.]|nr:SdpI family protein [Ruminococcus sp.]